MKPFNFISISFIVIFFFGFKSLTNQVFITGHLCNNPKDSPVRIDHISIFVKGGDKILAKAITDKNGNFNLTFTPKKEKSFDFYCNAVGIDTMFLATATTFESDTPDITLYIPAKYKTNIFGKIICPKCNHADKVYKIQYSDAPVFVRHIGKLGDTTYSPIYKGTYQESCTVKPAKYYCDRDKIKF